MLALVIGVLIVLATLAFALFQLLAAAISNRRYTDDRQVRAAVTSTLVAGGLAGAAAIGLHWTFGW